MNDWMESDECIQFLIDTNLENIADFERDIQNAENQLIQCRRDYNTRSMRARAGEMIEFLEKKGIPQLRETQAMIKEHVEILKMRLKTGLSYEEAELQLKHDEEQPTLF